MNDIERILDGITDSLRELMALCDEAEDIQENGREDVELTLRDFTNIAKGGTHASDSQ